jgi:hypothetical protein
MNRMERRGANVLSVAVLAVRILWRAWWARTGARLSTMDPPARLLATAAGRSLRVGVQAAVWTALQAALLLFAVWLVEAVRWYHIGGSLLLDGEGGHPIGVNLGDAVFWVLVFIPVWALPFGVFGAALGGARRRRRPQPDGHPTPL